jgi:hypothetical protein
MQFGVDKGQQLLRRCIVTCMHGLKEPRSLASVVHGKSGRHPLNETPPFYSCVDLSIGRGLRWRDGQVVISVPFVSIESRGRFEVAGNTTFTLF